MNPLQSWWLIKQASKVKPIYVRKDDIPVALGIFYLSLCLVIVISLIWMFWFI